MYVSVCVVICRPRVHHVASMCKRITSSYFTSKKSNVAKSVLSSKSRRDRNHKRREAETPGERKRRLDRLKEYTEKLKGNQKHRRMLVLNTGLRGTFEQWQLCELEEE